MFDVLPTRPTAAAITALQTSCNNAAAPQGLALTTAQAAALCAAHTAALQATGRVELGGGILPALAAAFAASPYVDARTWAATLAELQDIFYEAKNKTHDRLPDADLLFAMRRLFDGPCGGDPQALADQDEESLLAAAHNPAG